MQGRVALTGIAVGDFACLSNMFLIGTATFLAADAGGPDQCCQRTKRPARWSLD